MQWDITLSLIFLALIALVIGLSIAALVFWVWMITDVASRTMPITEKILWLVIVIIGGLVGAIVWLLVRPKK